MTLRYHSAIDWSFGSVPQKSPQLAQSTGLCYGDGHSNLLGTPKITTELLVEDQKNAELLNEYFSSVFTQEDISNIPEPKNMFKWDSNEKLTELKVTPNVVLEKLENLKVDKSPGGDNIHPKLLYELRGALAEPIAKLYNFSLSTGEVPTDWKEATITALFKKGNRSEPGNYRPVSLTSIVCKILESIIKESIVVHLNTFNLPLSSWFDIRYSIFV